MEASLPSKHHSRYSPQVSPTTFHNTHTINHHPDQANMARLSTILALASSILLPATRAWTVALINDNTCDTTAAYYSYHGNGMGDCVKVGDNVDNCLYVARGGSEACGSQNLITKAEMGMKMADGTQCFMGQNSICSMNQLFSSGCGLPAALQPSTALDDEFYVQCWDV